VEDLVIADMAKPCHSGFGVDQFADLILDWIIVTGSPDKDDIMRFRDGSCCLKEWLNCVLGNESCNEECIFSGRHVEGDREGAGFVSSIRNEFESPVGLVFPPPTYFLSVSNQVVRESCCVSRAGTKHLPGSPTPFCALPLDPVNIDD